VLQVGGQGERAGLLVGPGDEVGQVRDLELLAGVLLVEAALLAGVADGD
jgi:hypothetical protein